MNDLRFTIAKALQEALRDEWIREEDTAVIFYDLGYLKSCLLYTSPSPRDGLLSRMPSSA